MGPTLSSKMHSGADFTAFWIGFSSKQKPPQNNSWEWQHVLRFEESKTPKPVGWNYSNSSRS